MLKETVLRSNLIGSFERINCRGLNRLTAIIEDTYGGLVVGRVSNGLLVETTTAAVKNHRWTGSTDNSSRVGIGYYCSEAVYNTNFAHELCHNMVWQMGRPDSMFEDYVDMADEEEKLCWQFAIELCSISGLSLSKDVVDISTKYWNYVLGLRDPSRMCQNSGLGPDNVLTQIGQQERSLFGFSHIFDDQFFWQDDVPKLM
jgi:hypothetical protein